MNIHFFDLVISKSCHCYLW